MNGFTPVEQARRDKLAAMTPEERERAGWLASVRRVLDAAEARPGLPRPQVFRDMARFGLYAYGPEAPRLLAEAEAALGAALHVTFTEDYDESTRSFILEAVLDGGLKVQITAPACAAAEEKVTGQTVTDLVQWVRLPVEEPEPAEAGTAAAS